MLDEAGAAVAGARVEIARALGLSGRQRAGRRPVGGVAEASSVSASDGRFALHDLEPGRFDLAISAPGFVPAEVVGVAIAAGRGPAVLDAVRLRRATRIAGRVVDQDGAPVSGAAVALITVSADSTWRPAQTSGAARRPGGPRDDRGRGREQPPVADLAPGVEVSGWVLDEDGEPVSAASVTLETHGIDAAAVSAADGGFTLVDVPSGRHRLAVSHPRFATPRNPRSRWRARR